MAKKKKKSKKAENNVDLKPLLLVIFGIISGFIIYSEQTGGLGKVIKNILIGGVIGKLAYALPIALVVMGIYIVFRDFAKFKLKAFQFILLFVAIASLITCFDYNAIMQRHSADNWFQEIGIICSEGTSFAEADHEQSGGGLIGAIVTVPLIKAFDTNITTVILICILVVLGFLITGIAFSSIVIGIKEFLSKSYNKGKDNVQEMVAAKRARREEKEEAENLEMAIKSKNSSKKKDNKRFKQIMEQTEIVGNGKQIAITDLDLEDFEEDLEEEEEEPEEIDEVEEEEVDEIPDEIVEQKPKKKVLKPLHPENNRASAKVESNAEEIDIDTSSTEDYEEYIFPPISLLSEGGNDNEDYSTREMKEVASKLQNTLKSFNVDAKVVNVTRGPAVTQYEIQPNIGVKVSKIINLENDIALNLAAKSIRIEAPIPGKSAVGIEVPNKAKENVMLRDVIESDEFQDAPSKVTFALGKSIDGEPCVSDIAKMPHMLIAGATGSGKSVCINSILVSLLYKAKPNEVKLILIDPKVVELKVYNDIPHLLIPVVTDPKKAAGALNWAVQEMVNRYNLFAEKGVRDIRGYNDLLVQEGEDGLLPQIVIIIDELADLMMVAPSEVEDSIVRLTQMARAAGMHLIIATQRPSVDVVTGIIKANVPSRIAFTVSSQVDSRTILDMAGAEKLLGKGDMLYFPMGESKPIRIQGTYVSDKEVENIVEFVKKQNPGITYNPDIIESFEKANTPPQANSKGGDSPEPDCDELLTDAIELAVQMGNASASMIQRKFKVGYARAGRIIDQMEERGIVSGYDGSKPRQTLISKEEWEEMKEAGVDSVKYEEVDEDEYEEYEEDSESEDEEVYEDENEEYEEDDEEVEDSGEESDEEYEEEEEEDTEEEEE